MSAVTKRDDFGPITRNRSSSANEASRPSQMLQRRQTHVGTKQFNVSTSGGKFTDWVFFFFLFICLYNKTKPNLFYFYTKLTELFRLENINIFSKIVKNFRLTFA